MDRVGQVSPSDHHGLPVPLSESLLLSYSITTATALIYNFPPGSSTHKSICYHHKGNVVLTLSFPFSCVQEFHLILVSVLLYPVLSLSYINKLWLPDCICPIAFQDSSSPFFFQRQSIQFVCSAPLCDRLHSCLQQRPLNSRSPEKTYDRAGAAEQCGIYLFNLTRWRYPKMSAEVKEEREERGEQDTNHNDRQMWVFVRWWIRWKSTKSNEREENSSSWMLVMHRELVLVFWTETHPAEK